MKKSRQNRIIELVETRNIETQDDLADLLKVSGFDVTQATVSRDIRELRLTKIAVYDGKQKYVILKTGETFLNDKYIRVLRDGYISMEQAQNMLVIKTVAGMAMAVAASLDVMKVNDIVGIIAGDDTIMVVIKTTEDVETVMRLIKEVLG